MTTEQRTIEFHQAFKHPVRDTPQTLCRTEALLALALIEEEFWELAEALFPGSKEQYLRSHDYDSTLTEEIVEYPSAYEYVPDLIETADAIADLDVVVNGAGIRHGFDMQALSREVFASNMSKLDADGKPLYHPNGKIAKSELFKEPDIAGALWHRGGCVSELNAAIEKLRASGATPEAIEKFASETVRKRDNPHTYDSAFVPDATCGLICRLCGIYMPTGSHSGRYLGDHPANIHVAWHNAQHRAGVTIHG